MKDRKFNAKESNPNLVDTGRVLDLYIIQDIGVISIDSPIKKALRCSVVTKPAKSKCFLYY